MDRGSALIPQPSPEVALARSTSPKLSKNYTCDELKLFSSLPFWLHCAERGESTGRWRGAAEGLLLHGFGAVGLARAGPGSVWDSQHHQSWSLKNLEKPLEGKEDREEIKDTFLYWEAVKN